MQCGASRCDAEEARGAHVGGRVAGDDRLMERENGRESFKVQRRSEKC